MKLRSKALGWWVNWITGLGKGRSKTCIEEQRQVSRMHTHSPSFTKMSACILVVYIHMYSGGKNFSLNLPIDNRNLNFDMRREISVLHHDPFLLFTLSHVYW